MTALVTEPAPSADKLKKREYNRRYYLNNREVILAQVGQYARTHRAEKKEYNRGYGRANLKRLSDARSARKARNPEKTLEWQRAYDRKRLKDTAARLKKNLRTRIYLALRGINQSARSQALLGCSIESLRLHLESQFLSGMTWENYGPVWHVDHRKACAGFDLTDPEQQQKCFHFSNLQPLWAVDNIRKSDSV